MQKKLTIPEFKEQVVVSFWCQTDQERPFTTHLFRDADCAIYISDLTSGINNTLNKVAKFNEMLDKECREDVQRILIGNKADLTNRSKMFADECAAIA